MYRIRYNRLWKLWVIEERYWGIWWPLPRYTPYMVMKSFGVWYKIGYMSRECAEEAWDWLGLEK